MQPTLVDLSLAQQDHINSHVLGDSFPWYRQPWQTTGKLNHLPNVGNPAFFSHTLMNPSPDAQSNGQINSDYYDFFWAIFNKWMRHHGHEYQWIFRAAINCVGSNQHRSSVPHVDHDYPHWNWIMYLTDTPGAPTYLFDSEFNVVDTIECLKFHAATFKGQPHAQGFHQGDLQRMAVVFTWA
jgi:hypothetical protein